MNFGEVPAVSCGTVEVDNSVNAAEEEGRGTEPCDADSCDGLWLLVSSAGLTGGISDLECSSVPIGPSSFGVDNGVMDSCGMTEIGFSGPAFVFSPSPFTDITGKGLCGSVGVHVGVVVESSGPVLIDDVVCDDELGTVVGGELGVTW